MSELKLKVILVDDEPEASRNLKNILNDYIDVTIDIVAMAHNAAEAERAIQEHNPDVVFLDIEMPKENAFHFLKRIAPFNFEVVFVTAYDEYAIRAFKLNAVDYILKPISINELSIAVSKVRDRVRYKRLMQTGGNDLPDLTGLVNEQSKANSITLKENNIIEVVKFEDIVYIEANGGYSKVFFLKDKESRGVFASYSISDYEELLPPDIFYRVHKSYLINRYYIHTMLKEDSLNVMMYPEYVVPVSRRRITSLLEYLKTQNK